METLAPTPILEPEELLHDGRRPRVTISVSRATAAHLEDWLTEKRLTAAHEAAHCAVARLTEPGWAETDR
jgi:hypothetical protein